MPTDIPTTLVGSAPGEAQAVIDAARLGANATRIAPDKVYAFRTLDGDVKIIDGAEFREISPPRKTGTVQTFDAESFAAYVAEQHHKAGVTKVWVDETRLTAIGVLNGHGSDPYDSGYGDHRVVLKLTPTESWAAWLRLNAILLKQTQFAEHIEDNAPDVVQPTSAEMLEIAQSFQAKSKVDFQSAKYLANGHRALEFKETVEAKAGQRGQLEIPAEFALALRPFVGSDTYRVTARFRYRITDGQLTIGYWLNRPADVQRAAFADVIGGIREGLDGTGVPILNGVPS